MSISNLAIHNMNLLKLTHNCPSYLSVFENRNSDDCINFCNNFVNVNNDLPIFINEDIDIINCKLNNS